MSSVDLDPRVQCYYSLEKTDTELRYILNTLKSNPNAMKDPNFARLVQHVVSEGTRNAIALKCADELEPHTHLSDYIEDTVSTLSRLAEAVEEATNIQDIPNWPLDIAVYYGRPGTLEDLFGEPQGYHEQEQENTTETAPAATTTTTTKSTMNQQQQATQTQPSKPYATCLAAFREVENNMYQVIADFLENPGHVGEAQGRQVVDGFNGPSKKALRQEEANRLTPLEILSVQVDCSDVAREPDLVQLLKEKLLDARRMHAILLDPRYRDDWFQSAFSNYFRWYAEKQSGQTPPPNPRRRRIPTLEQRFEQNQDYQGVGESDQWLDPNFAALTPKELEYLQYQANRFADMESENEFEPESTENSSNSIPEEA